MTSGRFYRINTITSLMKRIIKELKKKRYSDGILWRILFIGKDLLWNLFCLLDIKASYYKYIYTKNILNTKPVDADPEIELHHLTCAKDFLNSIWAIKSFHYFSELKFRTVIHDDGTLSKNQKRIFGQHFTGGEIIEKKYADLQMKEKLRNFNYLSKNREDKKFYCALKLLDPVFFSRSDHIILLDSDILFFNKPEEILNHIKTRQSFFNSDFQNAYSHTIKQLKKITKIDILEKINAGLIYFNKTDYLKHLSLIETFFKKIDPMNMNEGINRREQTAHAILLSKIKAKRLSANYQISNQKMKKDTISYHFVNNGFRHRMYKIGLARLKSADFIIKFNEKNR